MGFRRTSASARSAMSGRKSSEGPRVGDVVLLVAEGLFFLGPWADRGYFRMHEFDKGPTGLNYAGSLGGVLL